MAIDIDLTSLETYIDIRNERMAEHVFKGAATATLTGAVDMDDITSLAVDETTLADFEGALSFVGLDTEVEAEMVVARLAVDRVMVSKTNMTTSSSADRMKR